MVTGSGPERGPAERQIVGGLMEAPQWRELAHHHKCQLYGAPFARRHARSCAVVRDTPRGIRDGHRKSDSMATIGEFTAPHKRDFALSLIVLTTTVAIAVCSVQPWTVVEKI